MDKKCNEVKILQNRYDEFNVHKTVKKVSGNLKKKTVGRLLTDKGTLIVDRHYIKLTFQRYIEHLFLNKK